MTKQEIMKQARATRDNERKLLQQKHLSLREWKAERERINGEYLAVEEANKPKHRRIPAWLKADNAGFERWNSQQHNTQ